jgi:hypothetical protein
MMLIGRLRYESLIIRLCNLHIKIHRNKAIDFYYRLQHFRKADLLTLPCLLHKHELNLTGQECVYY